MACPWSFLLSILQSLRALVAMNENLKSQEQEFKAHCRVSAAWHWWTGRALPRLLASLPCALGPANQGGAVSAASG